MEEGRSQTNSYVHRGHLILLHSGDIAQEAQQSLQNLPVLIRHQHDGCLHRLQPLLLGHVWGKPNDVQRGLLQNQIRSQEQDRVITDIHTVELFSEEGDDRG